MRAASVGTDEHGRGLPWDFSITWGVEYDLTGKVAVLQIKASPSGAVLFQTDSSQSAITITDQVMTGILYQNTTSTLDGTTTWADIDSAHKKLDYAIYVGPTSDITTAERRIQGDIEIKTTHGSF